MKIDLTRGLLILGTGVLMGALFSFQSKSVSQANVSYNRESRISIFKEMQITKKSNSNLREQVTELQKALADSNDSEQALEHIKKEINKYEVLTGEKPAKGPGIEISINGALESLWFTDLINELFSAGAEAVSVNGIRMTPDNLGFDTMPNGQVLFGGEILSTPFTFDAIGDSKALTGAMNQSGGIISRIRDYRQEYVITVSEKNPLELPAFIQEK